MKRARIETCSALHRFSCKKKLIPYNITHYNPENHCSANRLWEFKNGIRVRSLIVSNEFCAIMASVLLRIIHILLLEFAYELIGCSFLTMFYYVMLHHTQKFEFGMHLYLLFKKVNNKDKNCNCSHSDCARRVIFWVGNPIGVWPELANERLVLPVLDNTLLIVGVLRYFRVTTVGVVFWVNNLTMCNGNENWWRFKFSWAIRVYHSTFPYN